MKKLILTMVLFLTIGFLKVNAEPPKIEIYTVLIKTSYDKVLQFKVNDFKIKRSKLTMINSIDYEFPVKNTVYHDEVVSVEIIQEGETESRNTSMKHYLKKLTKKGYEIEYNTGSETLVDDVVADLK